MKKTLIIMLILSALAPLCFAARAWNEVEAPVITSVTAEGRTLTVSFTMATGADGADRGTIYIYENGTELTSRAIGRSSRQQRSADFTLDHSGSYEIVVESTRRGEDVVKRSAACAFDYTLPLDEPSFSLRNTGEACIEVTIEAVAEAECYIVSVHDHEDGSLKAFTGTVRAGTLSFDMLEEGRVYDFTVTAVRADETVTGDAVTKTARKEADRQWNFTWFGQSTKEELNRMEMLDSDNLSFRLYSTEYDENGVTTAKGGKFTSFHDGVSFYYTEIDPETENFILSATFTVDYINPTADGQEGFGLIVMDSLGEHGVSSVNHYTNSAGIIATKFEETAGGVKHTSKDTLGARFVTGLTPEVIEGGDTLIAQNGKVEAHAYSYDQSDLVHSGDVYTLTLKKDNTGYHAIYRRTIASEDTIEEFTLYDPQKLEVIDPDRSYVGFAVARGCNVTVDNVSMVISDPATDPPAQSEPDALLPLEARVDSPSSYFDSAYPFVFTANADGLLDVVSGDGTQLVSDAAVSAGEDFSALFTISTGVNDFTVKFTPDPDYRPAEKMTVAQYDDEKKAYVEDFSPVTIAHSVSYVDKFTGDRIHVSLSGDIFGDGSTEKPVDLDTALRYSRPGQTIVLEAGTWKLSSPIYIERGNSGKEGAPKTITVEDGRAILDFSFAGGGMQVWGDWWVIENIDITKTPDNVKGLQIAGDHNVVRFVQAYGCGDTGIQISGTSTEKRDKWPHDNLVESCISHDNMDSAQNNADGFAAKLTAGDGNQFRNCIAYSNIDDGWDLYSKVETGPIGAVVIDSCAAYANGSLSDGSGSGDGNGFKLGGDGIAVKHVISNSAAYGNSQAGITSNSNSALIVRNVTLYANGGENLILYGKGDGERSFQLEGVISMEGGEADDISQMPSLADETNYLWNGAQSINGAGAVLDGTVFISTDMSVRPEIDEDGSIDMHSLFEPVESIAAGARL